ncbi:hypothetical protein CYMTET_50630 [Cymbomonas tetramitiformis]|uniref:Uncharacterized protein n=1 Tax=Cymbomonas tetramitiformis TaxID=36881 RepID=A0AAE0BMT7_9CHLO|nr:hypothetical protein CYMTET_50630 [Cymbomonas tetramitiformis]
MSIYPGLQALLRTDLWRSALCQALSRCGCRLAQIKKLRSFSDSFHADIHLLRLELLTGERLGPLSEHASRILDPPTASDSEEVILVSNHHGAPVASLSSNPIDPEMIFTSFLDFHIPKSPTDVQPVPPHQPPPLAQHILSPSETGAPVPGSPTNVSAAGSGSSPPGWGTEFLTPQPGSQSGAEHGDVTPEFFANRLFDETEATKERERLNTSGANPNPAEADIRERLIKNGLPEAGERGGTSENDTSVWGLLAPSSDEEEEVPCGQNRFVMDGSDVDSSSSEGGLEPHGANNPDGGLAAMTTYSVMEDGSLNKVTTMQPRVSSRVSMIDIGSRDASGMSEVSLHDGMAVTSPMYEDASSSPLVNGGNDNSNALSRSSSLDSVRVKDTPDAGGDSSSPFMEALRQPVTGVRREQEALTPLPKYTESSVQQKPSPALAYLRISDSKGRISGAVSKTSTDRVRSESDER